MNTPEAQLQRAVASYLSLVLPDTVMWSAIGHGGGGKIRGSILKAMGLRRGLGDVYIAWRFRDHHQTLWLELKAKDGRQSDEQKDFQARVEAIGHFYRICRSVDEVVNAIVLCGVPTKARRVA